MPEVRPLRPGDPERIGDHRLLGVLGSGGQGIVYKGVDGTGRVVAIKLLHSHLTQDDDVTRGLLREAEAARRVAAFCTAAVLDVGVADGRAYIVSEYVAGDTLQRLVRESGPRTGGALDRLAISTLTALAAIHEAGIVHRDFKPGNVLMGPEGPIVIDFGIAKTLGATTQASAPMGTPAYMSPEQFGGERVGPASDVFSWAGTMVFAATGHPPYAGETVAAILHKVMSGVPDLTDVPARLVDPIRSCLAKDPAARPTPAGLLRHLISAPGSAHPTSFPSAPHSASAPNSPSAPNSASGSPTPYPPAAAGSAGTYPPGVPGSAHLRSEGPAPQHPAHPGAGGGPDGHGGSPATPPPPGAGAGPGAGATIPPPAPGATVPPRGPGATIPPSGAEATVPPRGPGATTPSVGAGAGATVPPGGATGPAFHGEATRPGSGPRVSRRAVMVGGAAAAAAAAASAFLLLRPANGLADDPSPRPTGDPTGPPATGTPTAPTTPTTPTTAATSPAPSTSPTGSPTASTTPSPAAEPFGAPVREPVALPAGSGTPAALAAAGSTVVCGTSRGTVLVWDLGPASAAVRRLGDGGAAVTAVAYGDGRAAAGHGDGTMRLWNPAGGALGRKKAADPVIAVTTAGRAVAVTQKYDSLKDLHSVVRLWDIATGRQIGPAVTDHFQGINGLAFGRLGDDDVLVTGDGDNRVRVRRLSDGKVTHSYKTGEIGGIELLACGELDGRPVLVSTHLDATLRVYDLATGRRRKKWTFSRRSPDDRGASALVVGALGGRPVAVVAHTPGGGETVVRVWSLTDGKVVGELGPGPGAEVRALALAELAGRPVVVGTGGDALLSAWSLGPA
ncbi:MULTISPECIES: protein kinase [unclassified Nonomuraea]|uniref:WD40 repeat domain-containing serine/threonine protein kinase n=1 Tax=unclassified Nonomuraea TaxID=2593643 RepID=UPI0033DED5A9